MQKVLRKRVLRNLRRHMGRYFALCLLVILGVFIVVSLLGAAQNIIDGTAEFAQKNRIEDGEWETFIPLRQEQLQELDGKGIDRAVSETSCNHPSLQGQKVCQSGGTG